MKKIVSVLLVVALGVSVLVVGCGQTTETERTNTMTTYIDDASDESFVGEKRIEQMYVTETYTDDTNVYHVLMEDTTGNVWEVTDIDLYEYEDVLVLMCDNNTEDITDDAIIHCWVGLE